MIEKIVAPLVVGLLVGFVLLFGPDIKEHFRPEKSMLYQITKSVDVLNSEDLGRKNIPILGKNVSNIHLTKVLIKNIGKQKIENIEIMFAISASKKPKLYRIFYTTNPENLFGKVSFNEVDELSRVMSINKFVENTSIHLSFISSEALDLMITANESGVKFNQEMKSENADDITYVAFLSAFSVLLGRILIDLILFIIGKIRKKA